MAGEVKAQACFAEQMAIFNTKLRNSGFHNFMSLLD
jgi:hypothetical protein